MGCMLGYYHSSKLQAVYSFVDEPDEPLQRKMVHLQEFTTCELGPLGAVYEIM